MTNKTLVADALQARLNGNAILRPVENRLQHDCSWLSPEVKAVVMEVRHQAESGHPTELRDVRSHYLPWPKAMKPSFFKGGGIVNSS